MAETDFNYEIIENEVDARYCAKILAEEFTSYNAITCFDRLTAEYYFKECSWPLMEKNYREGLSFLARDRSTNEIIGALLAGDLYEPDNQQDPNNQNRKYYSVLPLDSLLEDMVQLFLSRDFGQELKPNMALCIEMCAVRMQYSGKGIGKQMSTIACNYARDKRNFQYALAQVTNEATRHIFLNKMNGKEVTIMDPTTWVWKTTENEPTCPYKNYTGGTIQNILIKL